ncbi:MAG: cobalamin-dependent protein [Candidatus Thorarchaeota archaeon]|nr:cobalamin-dependent protein [Candidatus Thorarchaeota archaeon]
MKVFLIFPAPDLIDLRYASPTFSPPLGLLYIASSLREAGVEVKLIDQLGEKVPDEKLLKRVERYSPEVVGLSMMTWQAPKAAKLAAMIKEKLPDTHIVFGGVHATLNVERMMRKYIQIDSTITGEGELSMVELVRTLENGDSIQTVPGVYYRENGKVKRGALRKLIADLDSLPPPAMDLVKKEWYGQIEGLQWPAMTSMVSSRGCPCSCNFCCCNQFAGRKWRFRSPENVVDEIEDLLAAGFKTIFFADDCFTLNKKRILQIGGLIKKRRLEFSWLCEGRVDQIDYQTIRSMVTSGCKLIYLGLESANQRILDYYGKRITPQMGMQAVETSRKAGVDIILGTFIIGAPGETRREMQNTLDFTMKLNIDFPQINILGAMPGTELWDQLVSQQYIDPDVYWETGVLVPDIYPNSVKTAILERKITKVYEKFIRRKKYLLKQLLLTLKSPYRMGLFLRNVSQAGAVLDYVQGESSGEESIT